MRGLKTILMQHFGGQTRSIMGDVQMENSSFFQAMSLPVKLRVKK